MFKKILRSILSKLFGVKVIGMENYYNAGNKVLIISNHTSNLDWMFLYAFLPDNCCFAVRSASPPSGYLSKFWSTFVNFELIDPDDLNSLKKLINKIKNNEKCVMYPEVKVAPVDSIMRVYDYTGFILDQTGANILSVHIEGLQNWRYNGSKFLPEKFFPTVTINIFPHKNITAPENIIGKERRSYLTLKIYDIMRESALASINKRKTVFCELIEKMKLFGRKKVILEDPTHHTLTYGQLITKSFVLGNKLTKHTAIGEHVGIVMPNVMANAVLFFALQASNRIPTMLNFASGTDNVKLSCKTANIRTICTSKKFIEKAKLENLIDALQEVNLDIIYLEDIAKTVSLLDKLYGLVASFFPNTYYFDSNTAGSDDTAVILFTSGSENAPKAVVLSHYNVLSNIAQIQINFDTNPKDIILNALPMFHSFGLIVTTLTTVLTGIKTFLYPSPLHYRMISHVAYYINATILAGTDTLLSKYAEVGHPYDFNSLRFVFAGGEKLRSDTHNKWLQEHGIKVLETYGTTEASPAIAGNNRVYHKLGTVGRFLPGITYKLEDIPGISNGGRLFIKGPNVMKGYYKTGQPSELLPPKDDFYDTGDIVSIDTEGFITILGRAKRFAKIAGEMISLPKVESIIALIWPNYNHAIITLYNNKKGEIIILATTYKDANQPEMSKYLVENSYPLIYMPKKIHIIDEIPLLGTGKINYPELQIMVEKEYDKK